MRTHTVHNEGFLEIRRQANVRLEPARGPIPGFGVAMLEPIEAGLTHRDDPRICGGVGVALPPTQWVPVGHVSQAVAGLASSSRVPAGQLTSSVLPPAQ